MVGVRGRRSGQRPVIRWSVGLNEQGCVTLYLGFFEVGLRLLLHPFLFNFFSKCQIYSTQLIPKCLAGFDQTLGHVQAPRAEVDNSRCTLQILGQDTSDKQGKEEWFYDRKSWNN
ncbi:hypothetical protein PanWU01x14_200680, partial [Parasponia andersonii]